VPAWIARGGGVLPPGAMNGVEESGTTPCTEKSRDFAGAPVWNVIWFWLAACRWVTSGVTFEVDGSPGIWAVYLPRNLKPGGPEKSAGPFAYRASAMPLRRVTLTTRLSFAEGPVWSGWRRPIGA
jgi:hypothetical protein